MKKKMPGINLTYQDIWRWDLPEPALTQEDFSQIRSWGLDTVQISQSWHIIEPNMGVYDESYLARLDVVVDRIAASGLKCVLKIGISDWFAGQGGWLSFEALWSNPAVQERLYSLWEMLVTRYSGRLSACAILNEPKPTSTSGPWSEVETQPLIDNWNLGGISDICIERIRAIKPSMTILITFGPWGIPGHYNVYPPRPYSNIVYAFSWYKPQDVTFRGEEWTEGQDWIRFELAPAINFKALHGVPLLAQELGLNVKAYPITESRLKWIDDSLKVLNEEGIDWCYWVYSHWQTEAFSVLDDAGNELPTTEILRQNVPPPISPRDLLVRATLSAATGTALILLSL